MGPGQPFMVWVWIWKISPKNVKFFNFFPFRSKKISSGRVKKYESASYLLWVKSKLGSGRVGSGSISGFLFILWFTISSNMSVTIRSWVLARSWFFFSSSSIFALKVSIYLTFFYFYNLIISINMHICVSLTVEFPQDLSMKINLGIKF